METLKNTMERLPDCPFCFGQAAFTNSYLGDRDNRQAGNEPASFTATSRV
jgi:hypothetical protein